MLGFDLPPVHDPLLKERERPRMWLLVVAISRSRVRVLPPMRMATMCWVGSLIDVHHERDQAFEDGVFFATRKGIVLTNLGCIAFCRS